MMRKSMRRSEFFLTSRRRVMTGVARIPEGSDAATPTRARPTSTPSATLAIGQCRLDRSQCVIDLRCVLATTLGHIVLAAATAAKHAGCGAHQCAGLEAVGAGLVV